MRKTALPITLALALLPAAAAAQASASVGASAKFQLDLPIFLPQLVVVTPGVQVVPDVDHEVFFTDGFYWTRHGNGWYRSRSHRGGWVLVPARHVPTKIGRLPPGKYKRWKPAKAERLDRRDDDRGLRRDHDRRDHDRHDHDRYDDHRDRDRDDRGHGRGRGHDDDHDDHGRGRGKKH
jgi:hypothetical protein